MMKSNLLIGSRFGFRAFKSFEVETFFAEPLFDNVNAHFYRVLPNEEYTFFCKEQKMPFKNYIFAEGDKEKYIN